MPPTRQHQVVRGARFALRALVTIGSLLAWDTSRPELASARTQPAAPAECRELAPEELFDDELGEDDGSGTETDALSRPRRYQPCDPKPPKQPAPQRRCPVRAFNLLYAQVGKHCKRRERSCSAQTDTCATLSAKISAGYSCTNARELVQQQCYRAGDAGYEEHMQQIRNAYVTLRRCVDIQSKKCP